MSLRLEKKIFPALLTFPILVVVILLVKDYKNNVSETNIKPIEIQEQVVIATTTSNAPAVIAPTPVSTSAIVEEKKPEMYEYIQIVEGCASNFQGSCVNVRTRPTSTSKVAYKLRNGVILRVQEKITEDGHEWYKIHFDEWLRYPDRVSKDLYVAAEYVKPFFDEGNKDTIDTSAGTSTKRIVVDRTKQILYAYDGDELFMKEKVSTGIEMTPTPRGTFTIYKKTPSRYMQGPIPGVSTHYYDLPGVPWNLYFSKDGAVIHGAYWHESFGRKWSNGCVNLPIASAEKLYNWANVGTKVIVRD
jgi:lipoprotein-anchoring transpeptidase ErfK/SrfK